jgi:hypothetical protein
MWVMGVRLRSGLVAAIAAAYSTLALAAGVDVPVPPTEESFAPSWPKAAFKHDLWTAVLKDRVDEQGLVDYLAIRQDVRFREYLYRLARTDPAAMGGEKARLAFWINAYNALAIQGVLHAFPADPSRWASHSVLDVSLPGVEGHAFFVGLRFELGGRRYTLDQIEKWVILGRHPADHTSYYAPIGVGKPDPRVHFALVCCAKGCVKLRREAYEADRIDEQLDDAVRRFVEDEARVVFDRSTKTIRVSQLLDWYSGDLTNAQYDPHADSIIAFLARYVEDKQLARSLAREKWKMSYIEYDWSLNIRR